MNNFACKIRFFLIFHSLAFAIYTQFQCYSLLFAALKGHDEILLKRARHVITEIQRTRDAADALRKKDFAKVMCISNGI